MATNKNKSNSNNEMHNKKPDSGNLKFLINAQYLNLSFENPKAPNSLDKFLVKTLLSFK